MKAWNRLTHCYIINQLRARLKSRVSAHRLNAQTSVNFSNTGRFRRFIRMEQRTLSVRRDLITSKMNDPSGRRFPFESQRTLHSLFFSPTLTSISSPSTLDFHLGLLCIRQARSHSYSHLRVASQLSQ